MKLEDDIYDTAITDANLLAEYGVFKTDSEFIDYLNKRIKEYEAQIRGNK